MPATVVVIGVVAVVLLADVLGGDTQTEQTKRARISEPGDPLGLLQR